MWRGGLVRWVVASAAALALLAGLGVIGYRVFAPHETLTRPSEPYPDARPIDDERPFSELRAAPLIVDGRLRVYAEKWRVWADGPVGERYEATPYWAYRRWPAQLVGVVSVAGPAGPAVVSQWSDGQLVAIDARRGEIAWRANGPEPGSGYDGRRTGASVVYEPDSLLTVDAADGRPVVVARGTQLLVGYDAATGARLWQHPLPAGCRAAVWTGQLLVAVPDCANTTITFMDGVTGRRMSAWNAATAAPDAATAGGTIAAPAQCALGRIGCRIVRVGDTTWSLRPDARLTRIPALPDGAVVVADRVVFPTVAGVAARPFRGGSPQWTWNGQGQLVAANSKNVFLLTDDRTVLALSMASGDLEFVGCAAAVENEQWRLGHIYPADGISYIALERLTNAGPEAKDQRYYYGLRPIALVELYPPGRLPTWPGKFAACRPL